MWQPIESAPKDGTVILIGGPGWPVPAFWRSGLWRTLQPSPEGSPVYWMPMEGPMPVAPPDEPETKMMGKTVKVTCDGCGHDLTTRSNSVDYRLVLASESKPGHGEGFYTDMMIYPPVDRAYYFCGLQCLDRWRDREHHKSALWKTWLDKWKEDNGTKHAGFFSYPEPPREMRDSCKAEFEAAALAAFPPDEPETK